jgi:Icc-related predicted phosphoesterase
MKFLLTNDIHQHIPKWNQLVAAVQRDEPRFVLIAGDLLPKSAGFKGQRDFFPKLARHLEDMRKAGASVLLMFGNDDFHPLEPMLNELAARGLCVNMNGHVHREAGFTFCGVAQVRDYPFGYKHWCVPDGEFVQSAVQFCGEGLTIDEHGRWVKLPNLREHLLSKPSLEHRLSSLLTQLKADELSKSIWLIHQPPTALGMDICGDGQQVGSPTILDFIRRHQPLFGVSGHIHESPHQRSGRWVGLVRDSLWFQPGQMDERLHYVAVETTAACNIRNICHSIFGSTPIEFERFSEIGEPKPVGQPNS